MRLRAAALVLAAFALVGCSASFSLSFGGAPEGAGTITFGTSVSGTDLSGQTSTFPVGATVAWRAVLSDTANTNQLTLVFAQQNATGSPQTIGTQPWPVNDTTANLFTGTLDLSVTGVGAGTYVLTLTRGTTTLATGTFQVQ